MRKKIWIYSSPKTKVPDTVKVEVEAKATGIVNSFLKPEHIKPPPKNAKWNYIIDIYTKWHRNYFYFCAKYACPGPNVMSPYFETGFARLEYAGGIGRQSRFNLSYMRAIRGNGGRFGMAYPLSNVWWKLERVDSSTHELAVVFL